MTTENFSEGESMMSKTEFTFSKDSWYWLIHSIMMLISAILSIMKLTIMMKFSMTILGFMIHSTNILSIMKLSPTIFSFMKLSIMILSIECRYAQSRNTECCGALDKLSVGKMVFDQKTRNQLIMILKTFYCNSSSEYLS